MFKLLRSKWFWLGLVTGGLFLHYLTRDDSCDQGHHGSIAKDDQTDLKAS